MPMKKHFVIPESMYKCDLGDGMALFPLDLKKNG
jgi:hypothetical protein